MVIFILYNPLIHGRHGISGGGTRNSVTTHPVLNSTTHQVLNSLFIRAHFHLEFGILFHHDVIIIRHFDNRFFETFDREFRERDKQDESEVLVELGGPPVVVATHNHTDGDQSQDQHGQGHISRVVVRRVRFFSDWLRHRLCDAC